MVIKLAGRKRLDQGTTPRKVGGSTGWKIVSQKLYRLIRSALADAGFGAKNAEPPVLDRLAGGIAQARLSQLDSAVGVSALKLKMGLAELLFQRSP
jgi:hypothetical protein